MNTAKRQLLFVILVLTLLTLSTSVVFAKELGLLVISGPGIKGELNLDDHEAMMDLERAGFYDQSAFVKPPENLGEGYTITAHLNLDGKLVPYLEMIYYPTEPGEESYVHYIGRLNGQTLKSVDEWHALNVKTDGILRDLLAANQVTVQSALVKAPVAAVEAAQPAAPAKEVEAISAVPTVSARPEQPSYSVPALAAALILLFAVALLVMKRRAVSHPTA